MIIKNTTIQNRSKQVRLNSEHTIPAQSVKRQEIVLFLQSLQNIDFSKEQILYSIGVSLVNGNSNPDLLAFLSEYNYETIEIANIPTDEFDLLGSAYQFLNTKMENLEKGSFYTGPEIAQDFVNDLDFSRGQVIFDPACGSGAFLFNSNAPAEQIFGVDSDPLAIMIAKFNYFIKFPNAKYPKLYSVDFFDWFSRNRNKRFDYIIGNPPYGANIDLTKVPTKYVVSGESFSFFIEFCYQLLKESGVFKFLLPESILNVKRHMDIRDFILDRTNLARIKQYTKKFSGVMSDVYMLQLDKRISPNVVFENGVTTVIPKALYKEIKNHIFIHLSEKDVAIIDKVKHLKRHDLSSSIFGLGIVTGDNKKKLFQKQIPGAEPIYTGKEIVNKYKFLPPKNYIFFERANLQQVAPDEIYRAPAKLVYKTINKYLKIVIDTTGALTSNSANIFIPTIKGLDIYTIMALLNSNLYSYLHLKMFGGVNKIAKENLMALPLPGLTKKQDEIIKKLTLETIKKGNDEILQKYINETIFGLTPEEISYINDTLARGGGLPDVRTRFREKRHGVELSPELPGLFSSSCGEAERLCGTCVAVVGGTAPHRYRNHRACSADALHGR